MEEDQRSAMFNAWKEKHDREVKKCVCEIPKPRPTDLNNCWDCDGEIYKDYLDKVRHNLPMKQKIKEEIYKKDFEGDCADIRFSDLPKTIQDNDIIEIRREEAFFSENNSYDAYTELVVIRERDETDDEYQKRISDSEFHKEELKKRRYENYLKLKSEFEPQSLNL